MREIKFRAWNRINKQMYWWGIPETSDGYITTHEFLKGDVVIMQFTGLPDKQGKEVYEGDIVKHPLCVKEPHDINEPCETFIGRIQFEVGRGQYFAVNIKRNGYVIVMGETYKFEVIGNIYENPELIPHSP